jgi:hypothetical protein
MIEQKFKNEMRHFTVRYTKGGWQIFEGEKLAFYRPFYVMQDAVDYAHQFAEMLGTGHKITIDCRKLGESNATLHTD